MTCPRSLPDRHRERGNSLVLAMIVLAALGTLSALTVVSVQGGLATTGNDRFHAIAVYAAESGGAAAMDFLRKNVNLSTGWTSYVSPGNASPPQPNLPGNNVGSGVAGNLFSSDMLGWYSVQILNNRDDTGFATGADNDKRVIIHVTGYGPNGAVAVIEWQISAQSVTGLGRPCSVYAQRNESEDDSGRNDCLGLINTSDTATFRPGG
ncbi:MAG TPA: pilus assembly PilX N-terminal domain-containing protein [Kofleriaceae bacterium]|nr:pilus assembly PilX N-terminal domain-containing protein [Kofleriaceae bacterium]